MSCGQVGSSLDLAPRGAAVTGRHRASPGGEASHDAESSELINIRSKNRIASRSSPQDRPRSRASPTRTRSRASM